MAEPAPTNMSTGGSASKWPSSPRRPRRKQLRSITNPSRSPGQVTMRGASLALLIYCLTTITSDHRVLALTAQHGSSSQHGYQLFNADSHAIINQTNASTSSSSSSSNSSSSSLGKTTTTCSNGLLTFEIATGFIYKPASAETLAMMPSTLQLTDCLDYCLQNSSCLAINFEMGLCVLLSSSAKQNPQNLYSSQFPVFTIYAEKKCLLQGDEQAAKQRHRCQRAWTFERVAGYEMKTRPRRRIKVASKELCMESCLLEREFECRSANWYRLTNECTFSDQDRHSVSQSDATDQQIKGSLHDLYGPSNLTAPGPARPTPSAPLRLPPGASTGPQPGGLYQNYYMAQDRLRLALAAQAQAQGGQPAKALEKRSLALDKTRYAYARSPDSANGLDNSWPPAQYVVELPAQAPVDYLENNCVYEPNKLCEFRKIQNRVLKTVDSIYQDVGSLEECKQKCLNAPYRCYSFDYGDTSERVCRTSHLDQASLLSVKEPYLDVVGAITYELASCFNVTIQCRAREMVAQVSSSKMFRGKIYVKSRPSSCANDVRESLKFELAMRYHDEKCDVRASSNSQQGVFSNDIVIQHHDRIVTTQDVGLSVYCQYDLGNRSITNNVDLAIDRIDEAPPNMEGKTQPGSQSVNDSASLGSASSPLTITSLATTVVRSPNVTMRITNMNGQPMASATVGDRLALLFEIKEKTSPFGIFVREIVAMDGKQLLAAVAANKNNNRNKAPAYHYGASYNDSAGLLSNESAVESMFQANKANSVQFIDSDGCPTDANIMGPLVKMDPSGHRVLAPFDAFKFPTSDMVFFRAVVTSCVSECKPVVCPPQPGGRGDSLDQYTTTTELVTATATLPTTTVSQFDQLVTTTLGSTSGRNMLAGLRQQSPAPQQPAHTDSPIMITSYHHHQFGAESPGPTRRWSQAAGGETGAKEQQRGDSLTTVPGFGVTETPVWHANSNIAAGSNNSNKLASSLIETLNAPQRQQLVKLFENKLKQHLAPMNHLQAGSGSTNASLAAEMAQIYKNFITSLVGGQPTSEPTLDSSYRSREDNVRRTTEQATTANGTRAESARLPLDLEGFLLAHLLADAQNNGTDGSLSASGTNERAASQHITPTRPPANRYRSQRNEATRKQSLADDGELPTPPGAYKSFGKRRRRRHANEPASEQVKQRAEPISSGFVSHEQLLDEVAPSLGAQARFTKATVEMYPVRPADTEQRRQKREAQPFYELDELVVQSIKIMDKPKVQEEEPALKRTSAARSSLVTRWHNGHDHQAASGLDMTGDEPMDPMGDSPASESSSSGQQAATGFRPLAWSSSGVLSLLVVASSFVFLQICLVLVCLVEWNQKRRRRDKLAMSSATSSISRGSTLSNDTRCPIFNDGTIKQQFYSPEIPSTNTNKIAHLHLLESPQRALGRRELTSSLVPLALTTDHYYATASPPSNGIQHQVDTHKRYHRDCDDCVACRLPKSNPKL